jgi:hypothetical protein
MGIRFVTNKVFCILKKCCCGGEYFLNKDATTEVSQWTLYVNVIPGYHQSNRAANDQFLRDQPYVVPVCCTPGVDVNSGVLRLISKVVLLTQSTPAIYMLVTSTHCLPFHYSQYQHFETHILKQFILLPLDMKRVLKSCSC